MPSGCCPYYDEPSEQDIAEYKGMGPAKAITIMAACELGKRRSVEKLGIRPDLGSSLAVYNYMLPPYARPRRGGSMGSDDEPEFQTHQG